MILFKQLMAMELFPRSSWNKNPVEKPDVLPNSFNIISRFQTAPEGIENIERLEESVILALKSDAEMESALWC